MPTGLMVEMKAIAREFFSLPPEEKAKLYSDDPAKKIRLSTSFNIRKETVRNGRDYLRLHCYPLEDFVPVWPSKPPSFRSVFGTNSGFFTGSLIGHSFPGDYGAHENEKPPKWCQNFFV